MEEKTIRFENKKQEKGFTQTPNHILLNNKIPYQARFLFIILLRYAWNKQQCFPGQTRIAEDIGVSQRTIRNWLSDLEQHGLIEIIQRGLNKTNLYVIKDFFKEDFSDRNQGSDQEWNQGSDQEWNQVADKEYSVEVDSFKKTQYIHANSIFDWWKKLLSQVNNPRLTKKLRNKIETKINKWSEEELKSAIDHYHEVYTSDYYYSHNWTLYKFVEQGNGAPRFLPGLDNRHDGDIWKNYQDWKKNKHKNNGLDEMEMV